MSDLPRCCLQGAEPHNGPEVHASMSSNGTCLKMVALMFLNFTMSAGTSGLGLL